MDNGKTFHTFKHMLDNVLPIVKYQYFFKGDDDTVIHVPNLHKWMVTDRRFVTHKDRAFVGHHHGGHYCSGILYGVSSALLGEMLPQVEDVFRGGYYEDWLFGFWVRVYVGDVTDIAMNSGGVERYYHWEDFEDESTSVTSHMVIYREKDAVAMHPFKDMNTWLYIQRSAALVTDGDLPLRWKV